MIGVALVGDFFIGKTRERLLALQTTIASISAFLLNNLGGVLGEYGWRLPYYVYSIGFVLAIAAALFLVEPPKQKTATTNASVVMNNQPIPVSKIIVMYLLGCFIGFVFLTLPVNFGFLFHSIGVESSARIGLAYGMNSLAVILGTLIFVWKLAGRTRVETRFMVSFVIAAIGYALLSQATSYMLLLIGGVVCGVGCGIFLPSGTVWAMTLFSDRTRGLGMGFYMSAQFFGNFLAGVAVVWLASLAGSRADVMMIISASLVMCALLALARRASSTVPGG